MQAISCGAGVSIKQKASGMGAWGNQKPALITEVARTAAASQAVAPESYRRRSNALAGALLAELLMPIETV